MGREGVVSAYYNEHDPYAAEWLRNLIKAGHIAPGVVDERSIEDVSPNELKGYNQCHFFAGIGIWSLALRRAGWSDDRPVWTGSCPCQPFSAAGKAGGFDDERHLWPAFHHLIEQCKPDTVFGEQVASKDGLAWFDLVQADLEGAGYSTGAVDICSAGVGAPHIRQRLWFVAERLADSNGLRQSRERRSGTSQSIGATELLEVSRMGEPNSPGPQQGREGSKTTRHRGTVESAGGVVRLADSESKRSEQHQTEQERWGDDDRHSSDGRLADSEDAERKQSGDTRNGRTRPSNGDNDANNPSPTNGLWRDADWLFCRDGKWRPVEPGTFPLAHGASSRVGRLRAYGNAINAEAAEEVIKGVMFATELKDILS